MSNKVLLIVGATSMIGQASAHLLAKDWKLILLAQDQTKLQTLQNKLAFPGDARVVDISSESQITTCINSVIKTYGRIDAVVYNTAIYPWQKIASLSLEDWSRTLAINLTGAFLITKSCATVMKKQRSGKIVYVTSIAGETIGLPHMSVYATSKAGLNGFMRTAAIEFAPFNINVNSISPGKIYDTSSLDQEVILKKIRSLPLGRFITAQDIAHMIDFLISEKAQNITGQNFIIDGGQSILGEEEHITNS